MSESPRPRVVPRPAEAPPAPAGSDRPAPTVRRAEPPPFLLDFFPLESEKETRLSRFFER